MLQAATAVAAGGVHEWGFQAEYIMAEPQKLMRLIERAAAMKQQQHGGGKMALPGSVRGSASSSSLSAAVGEQHAASATTATKSPTLNGGEFHDALADTVSDNGGKDTLSKDSMLTQQTSASTAVPPPAIRRVDSWSTKLRALGTSFGISKREDASVPAPLAVAPTSGSSSKVLAPPKIQGSGVRKQTQPTGPKGLLEALALPVLPTSTGVLTRGPTPTRGASKPEGSDMASMMGERQQLGRTSLDEDMTAGDRQLGTYTGR